MSGFWSPQGTFHTYPFRGMLSESEYGMKKEHDKKEWPKKKPGSKKKAALRKEDKYSTKNLKKIAGY